MLEHVEDLDSCLVEMKRVLAPGGIMIHSMPTGTWKLIQVAGRPMASVVRVARRLVPGVPGASERAQPGFHAWVHVDDQSKRSLAQKIVGQFILSIHGVSGNHIQEFIRFRPRWWRREYNTIRPHNSLGYRPPVPETVMPRLQLVAIPR